MSKTICKAAMWHEECNAYFEIKWTTKTSMKDVIKKPMLSNCKHECLNQLSPVHTHNSAALHTSVPPSAIWNI